MTRRGSPEPSSITLLPAALGWPILLAALRTALLALNGHRAARAGRGVWAAWGEIGGGGALIGQVGLAYLAILLPLGLVACWLPLRGLTRHRRWRRRLTPWLLLAALGAVDLGARLLPEGPAVIHGDPRPREESIGSPSNLLLVTIDTLRVDALGGHGALAGRTPNLDWLCRRGFQLARCTTPIPVTTPAHACLLTGASPAETGSLFNAVPLARAVETLAEALSARGYGTVASVGAFPLIAKVSGLDRGFRIYAQYLCPGRLHPLLWSTPPGKWAKALTGAWSAERPARVGNALALAFLPPEPFFLWIHYYEPHLPYDPPFPWAEMEPGLPEVEATVEAAVAIDRGGAPPGSQELRAFRSAYRGEVAAADEALGDLLLGLARRGVLDRTVVAVVADHGESLGEHDYYFSHGRHLYGPSLGVPAVVAGPGVRPGIADHRADLPGMAPALLGLLLGESSLDGASPLRTPPLDGWACLTRSFAHPPPPQIAESGEGVFLGPHAPDPDMVRSKRYAATGPRYRVIRHAPDAWEAFDLERDPAELYPLADREEPEVRMLEEVARRRAQQAEEAHPIRVDAGTEEALRALGYLGGDGEP